MNAARQFLVSSHVSSLFCAQVCAIRIHYVSFIFHGFKSHFTLGGMKMKSIGCRIRNSRGDLLMSFLRKAQWHCHTKRRLAGRCKEGFVCCFLWVSFVFCSSRQWRAVDETAKLAKQKSLNPAD